MITIDPDYFLEVLKDSLKNDRNLSDEDIGVVLYLVRLTLQRSMIENRR